MHVAVTHVAIAHTAQSRCARELLPHYQYARNNVLRDDWVTDLMILTTSYLL